MPIKKLPYKSVEHLLTKSLSLTEEDGTYLLTKKLKPSRKRGWLTKDELIEVCYWKSPRAIRHIKSNHSATIKKMTSLALSSRSEQVKIAQLTKLKGVSIPMASAILTLLNPKRYGVIDIRVWEIMLHFEIVTTNQKGAGFNFNEWYRYLMILRYYATKFNVQARDIERTLFNVHKDHQDGTLYRASSQILFSNKKSLP